ncbi:MAG: hypothetical protein JNK14_00585 [Chitinophagaceae bacterium]|nr:hypothetical protein [Chitinophagaceae bacterium]
MKGDRVNAVFLYMVFFKTKLPSLLSLTAVILLMTAASPAFAQGNETLIAVDSNSTTTIDTSAKGKKKVHNPGKAALRSAILPGWGQIYNKKYWKLPIVYGALGTSAGVFIFNLTSYRDTRFAYKAKYKVTQPGATAADTAELLKIKPPLERYSLETLRYYRDQYRRDIDYAVLFFVALWGLNVVDAAVDAHLKSFDVSRDLSFKLKPGRSEIANTNGLSLVLTIGKNINPRPLKNTFAN